MIPASPLYAICDADICARAGWTLVDFASACLDGGARFLQIRAKRAPSGWLLDATLAIVERAAAVGGADIVVNDRADIARLAGASGVHVGQDDLTATAVRRLLGDTAIVGLSTHTLPQMADAVTAPVSYIAIGPVFQTVSKDTGYHPVGIQRVREAARAAEPHALPVVAIGGITLERAKEVLDAGASAVAVIADLLVGGDPRARTRQYVTQLTRL